MNGWTVKEAGREGQAGDGREKGRAPETGCEGQEVCAWEVTLRRDGEHQSQKNTGCGLSSLRTYIMCQELC